MATPASPTLSETEISDSYIYLLSRLLVLRQQQLDFQEGLKWNERVHRKPGEVDWPNPNLDVAYSEAWVPVDEKSFHRLRAHDHRPLLHRAIPEWLGRDRRQHQRRVFPPHSNGDFAICLEGSQVPVPAGALRIDVPVKYMRGLARVELGSDWGEAIALQHKVEFRATGEPTLPTIPKTVMFDTEALPGVEAFESAELALDSDADINPGMAQLQATTRAIAKAIKDPAERQRLALSHRSEPRLNSVAQKQTDIAASFPINHIMESTPLFTRREMLGVAGMAGLTALAGITPLAGSAAGAVPQTMHTRPRIACIVSFWGAPGSHADWIIGKLMDGYWWQGAHTPSRVDVVSVYIHQFDTSLLGQKVCKAKHIPIYKTVAEAVKLGGTALAVDGVVIVGEHGEYPTDLKGHWLLPRWWMYQQVIRVFEQSKRSVPVFNDKHLSYNWDDAKWMFDKSRELNFPLTGGSSIPTYFRKPEIDLVIDTPIKNSIVVGGAADEGAIFHCVDVLQAFVERRKGGETGVKSVQSIRGPETWKWVERNRWAGKLLDSVATLFDLKPGSFQESAQANVCIVEYNDGTKAAVMSGRGVGWTYAGEIEGQQEPTIVSMLDWPGPYSQYHAANGQPHWITEMMVTKKEPFNAERLLLSTGIVNHYMDSNWENGRYSAVGHRIETPFMNMRYHTTRGPMFEKGERPPNIPYIRGFDK